MKHLLALLTLVVGLTTLPATTFAKDRRHDDDWKDLRSDLGTLQHHYDLMKDRVKYQGEGDRRLWSSLHDIRDNIDRINSQVSSGRFDGRDVSNQIRQADDDLNRLQAQLDRHRSGGGYYRPN